MNIRFNQELNVIVIFFFNQPANMQSLNKLIVFDLLQSIKINDLSCIQLLKPKKCDIGDKEKSYKKNIRMQTKCCVCN